MTKADRPLHLFCGLSVSHVAARAVLPPSAVLHAPIRRGDIPAVVDAEASPGTIAIIDGVFHSQETLTLTEIRRAIARGWTLIGCSSMGALRAVEAEPLGMKGFGTVYRWLRLFRVEDDDEVAQIMNPESFEALSMAMVDVRWHVSRLRRAGVLSREQGKSIVGAVKSHYYPQRTRALLADLVGRCAADGERSARMSPGAEAPKQKDAARLLDALASGAI